MPEALLECRAITKRFGGILALDRVFFDLLPGEVHGLVGSIPSRYKNTESW